MKHFSLLFIGLMLISVFTVTAQDTTNHSAITVENAVSVTQIAALEGHEGAVNSVAFSPDGTLIASGGEDTTVRLWDVSASDGLYVLEGHEGGVNAVVFNPDGTFLASTGYDMNVLVWDPQDGTMTDESITLDSSLASLFDTFAGSDVGFHALAWLDNTPIAAGEGGLANFTARINYSDGDPTYYSFDVSSNGLMATGESDGVRVASLTDNPGEEAPVLSGHTDAVLAVKFDMAGGLLASGSADGTVRLWDVEDPEDIETIAVLEGHEDQVTGVALSPDGTLLVSSSLDGTLRFWNMETRQEVANLSGPAGTAFRSVAFSPDGTLIASACSDGVVRLWGTSEAEISNQAIESEIPASTTQIATSFGMMTVVDAEFMDAYPKGCDPTANFSCFAVPTEGLKILMVYFEGVNDGTAFTDQHENAYVTDAMGNRFGADLYGLSDGQNFYGFAVPESALSVNDFSLVWNDGEETVIPLILSSK